VLPVDAEPIHPFATQGNGTRLRLAGGAAAWVAAATLDAVAVVNLRKPP
jgi:hypothetical protein